MVECGAKRTQRQSTCELTAHAHEHANTHTYTPHRHNTHTHTLSCSFRQLRLRAALIMPRNINVYPFRFFGDVCHAPCACCPSAMASPFRACVIRLCIVCRLSPSPALTWQWVRVALCLMACVVPLDLTAVASAVNAACCVLRRLPVSSACPTQH